MWKTTPSNNIPYIAKQYIYPDAHINVFWSWTRIRQKSIFTQDRSEFVSIVCWWSAKYIICQKKVNKLRICVINMHTAVKLKWFFLFLFLAFLLQMAVPYYCDHVIWLQTLPAGTWTCLKRKLPRPKKLHTGRENITHLIIIIIIKSSFTSDSSWCMAI